MPNISFIYIDDDGLLRFLASSAKLQRTKVHPALGKIEIRATSIVLHTEVLLE
jgi:hypothetical protein